MDRFAELGGETLRCGLDQKRVGALGDVPEDELDEPIAEDVEPAAHLAREASLAQ